MKADDEGHPLFPDFDGEVGFIHVTRAENGRAVFAPRLFAAEELTDIAQLYEMYGGGSYELIARDPQKRGMVARRSYSLPGAPKALVEGAAAAPPAQALTAAPVAMPQSDGGLSQILPLLMQMMMQGQQQQTQLMLAVMNGQQSNSKDYVASMQQLHNSHAEQMARLMVQNNGGGAGGAVTQEAFMKGLEFAKQTVLEKMGASGEKSDELLETLNALAETVLPILFPNGINAPAAATGAGAAAAGAAAAT